MNVIESKGLVLRYGDFTAVNGIDIEVHEGEIFGLLGPNGAGKTTSVKVLTTMMRPTSGQIIINSVDTKDDVNKARSMIGVVQQHFAMDMDISVRENIISRAVLHKIPLKVAKARMMELCEAIAHEGCCRCGSHAVLTGSGLRDESGLAHFLGK